MKLVQITLLVMYIIDYRVEDLARVLVTLVSRRLQSHKLFQVRYEGHSSLILLYFFAGIPAPLYNCLDIRDGKVEDLLDEGRQRVEDLQERVYVASLSVIDQPHWLIVPAQPLTLRLLQVRFPLPLDQTVLLRLFKVVLRLHYLLGHGPRLNIRTLG